MRHTYLQALITPNFLNDKIGITTVARMCHLQVAIVLKDKIWCTNHPSKAKRKNEHADIFLAYFGNKQFEDTRGVNYNMPNALECGFIEDTEALVQNEHSKTVQHNIKQEDLVHGCEYVIRPSCSSVGKQIKQEFYLVLGTLTLDTVEKKTFPNKLETGGHTKYSAVVC